MSLSSSVSANLSLSPGSAHSGPRAIDATGDDMNGPKLALTEDFSETSPTPDKYSQEFDSLSSSHSLSSLTSSSLSDGEVCVGAGGAHAAAGHRQQMVMSLAAKGAEASKNTGASLLSREHVQTSGLPTPAPTTDVANHALHSSSQATSVPQKSRTAQLSLTSMAPTSSTDRFVELPLRQQEPQHELTTRFSKAAPSAHQTVGNARTMSSLPSAAADETSEHLSPWEQWLVKKAKLQRQHVQEQQQLKALASQKAKAKEREVKSKRSKAEDAWQDWCRMKSRQESIKKHQREVQQLEEARKNEQLKRRTNEKAQGAFKQWVEQKSSEKLAAEEAEQRRRQKKEKEEVVRQQEAQEAFEAWCLSADQRLGKERRREMFDVLRAPLSPTYKNPEPWQPIHVPVTKRRTRRQPARAKS